MAYTESTEGAKRKAAGKGSGAAAALVALLLVGAGVTAAVAGGGKKKPKPPKPPEPDPNPQPNPDPNALKFDLCTNWGGIPPALRAWLARGELASGIPGLARALAVKWWQSFRAKKPFVSTDEAAKIAQENPELSRFFINKGDAAPSKKILDAGIAQGWPKPTDYAGWAAASYGLGDILGGVAVYSGVHTDPKNKLAFVKFKSAKAAMQTYEVQIGAAAYIVRRVLFSDKYQVLVPGPNSNAGDSLQTWGNTFAAYAYPDAYAQGLPLAVQAKTDYMARAVEIGIDLSKVAYPWPPGKVYSAPTWTFAKVWALIQTYAKRAVDDTGIGCDIPDQPPGEDELPEEAEPDEQPSEDGVELDLEGGYKAFVYNADLEGEVPLVFVLHGRDGSEKQLLPYIDLGAAARFAFVRGNKKGANGYRYFDAQLMGPEPALAADIEHAAVALQPALKQVEDLYPGTVSRVVLVGYSQGAAVAYRVAVKGGAARVLAIAGYLPPPLRPVDHVSAAVWAIHGELDKSVPIVKGEQTLESFIMKAISTEFDAVPTGDHGLKSLGPQIAVRLPEVLA